MASLRGSLSKDPPVQDTNSIPMRIEPREHPLLRCWCFPFSPPWNNGNTGRNEWFAKPAPQHVSQIQHTSTASSSYFHTHMSIYFPQVHRCEDHRARRLTAKNLELWSSHQRISGMCTVEVHPAIPPFISLMWYHMVIPIYLPAILVTSTPKKNW